MRSVCLLFMLNGTTSNNPSGSEVNYFLLSSVNFPPQFLVSVLLPGEGKCGR